MANATTFSPNLQFMWDDRDAWVDWQTDPDFNDSIALHPEASRADTEFDVLFSIFFPPDRIGPNHDPAPGTINVYFTGNVLGSSGNNVNGFTREPDNLGGMFPLPYIMINDRAFEFGTSPDPAGLQSRLTQEHEMGHYLGRFKNMTLDGRMYNSTEHVTDPAHLMVDGALVQQNTRVLFLGPTEQDRIETRIDAGTWNNP